MSAHSGEIARETGDFRCSRCHEQTHVSKGDKIPKCPHCGNGEFDTRYHEPNSRSRRVDPLSMWRDTRTVTWNLEGSPGRRRSLAGFDHIEPG
jgi:NAD-dependent SIR2 family protein deacetylase